MKLILLTMIICLGQSPQETQDRSPSPEVALPTPVSAWRFEQEGFTGGIISDHQGDFDLRLAKGGLLFTGEGVTQAVLLPEGARALDLARDVDSQSTRVILNVFGLMLG